MENLKIVEILKTFSPEEVKEFDKFLQSPYFKKERDVNSYFKIIRSYHPDFNDKNFTKEKIYGKLFKSTKKDSKKEDATFRALNTELIRLCEEFIAMQTFRQNKIVHDIFLSEGLVKKHLIQRAEKNLDAVNKSIENIGFGPQYFKDKFDVAYTREELTRVKDKRNIIYDVHKSEGENLIYFFIAQISKVLLNLNTNKQVFNIEDNEIITNFLKNINFENFLNDVPWQDSVIYKVITFYYNSILISFKQLEKEDVRKYYFKLKQSYYEIFEHLSPLEKHSMATFLSNFCIDYNNQIDFLKEGFEINKFRIENNIYKVPGLNIFPHIVFKQMLETALNLKEFEWAEKLILNHIADLKEEHREDLKNYSYALLYYGKGEHEKSLEYILNTDSKEVNFIIGLKSTQIKNYFELILKDKRNEKYFENLLYSIDSCRHFLDNKKLTKENSEEGKYFLNNVSILARYLKNKDNEFELQKLIENQTAGWTKAKAKELLNNKN